MPRRRHRALPYVLGAVVLLCMVLAAAVWVGLRAFLVKDELEGMQSAASQLTDAVAAGDLHELGVANEAMTTHAKHAVDLSGDPVWALAQSLPLIGPNLSAVRTTALAVHTTGVEVVTPLLRLASSSDSATGMSQWSSAFADDGAIAQAAAALHRAADSMATVPADELVPPLASGVRQLNELLTTADDTLGPLASSAAIIPQLIDPASPKTILVMLQNPAELRTGGGITGTFIQLRSSAGGIQMQSIRDSTAFPYRAEPIAPVPSALSSLYGDVVGRFVQDTSIPADFTLTARLASSWWTSHGGAQPDAVVSIDPLVLQAILRVSGPLALPDGSELSADNLVDRLLVEPYMSMTSQQQGVFFLHATQALAKRLFVTGLSPVQWVQALMTPVQDGRISAWSADAKTQKAIERGPLGGPLVRQKLAGTGAYAVYFNDNTGGKMASYMTTKITDASGTCRADGKRTVQIAVSLTSTAPKNAGAMPISMTGGGLWGVGAGDIGMNVSVAAPKGSYFGGVTVDGVITPSVNVDAEGHPTSIAHVNLQPGETNVIAFQFIVTGHHDVSIVHTPMLSDPQVVSEPLRCSARNKL